MTLILQAASKDWLTLSVSALALVVSVTSVVVGVVIAVSDRRAKRREATLRAWLEWRDESMGSRRLLARCFADNITAAQAEALRRKLPNEGLPDPASKDRAELARAFPESLNGLERIGVGVQLGLFDADALATMGQLIILRHHERCLEYVKYVRAVPGNSEVYSGMTDLVRRMERHRRP